MVFIPIGDILAFLWILFVFPKVLVWLIYMRKEWKWEEDRRLQELLDIKDAREAIAESEREGFVSWEEFKAGLEDPDFES